MVTKTKNASRATAVAPTAIMIPIAPPLGRRYARPGCETSPDAKRPRMRNVPGYEMSTPRCVKRYARLRAVTIADRR